MEFLLLVGGFVGLIVGGELLVRGAVSIAQRFNVSPMIIGLTLVGFGTSTPELVTSVQAALVGSPGIAVGNVVGSNIANILLILGVAAICAPIAVSADAFRRDGSVLVIASALCVAAVLYGHAGRLTGLAFLFILAGYLALTIHLERRRSTAAGDVYAAEAGTLPQVRTSLAGAIAFFAVGLLVTIVGARYLVAGAVKLAESFGVSEAVIGLTIVAIGTSMPELVTSIIAARKGQSDVAFGNVIGSNIFNILGILGVTAFVHPIAIPDVIADFDIWVMVAATAALLGTAITGWRITRTEGGALVAFYVGYLGYLVASA